MNQYTSAMGEAIAHDGNGNMSSNGTNDYVHDAVNRLTTATVGSTTWTYAYGPLDRRMSKADGTNTIQYLYDNDRAVAEYNGSGTLLRKYIYGPGLDEPIMMIVPGDPNETVYYYHADAQGTIIGLTNDSGAWVEKYAYTLYGKPAAQSTVGNPYMYTGRRLDTETGLYYYRARYYDPNLRRFIETDPIGYAGGMNMYAYVGNSPINFIDPLGLVHLNNLNSFDDNFKFGEIFNPPGDEFTYWGHGAPPVLGQPGYLMDKNYAPISPEAFRKMIKQPQYKYKRGQSIALLSCFAGKGGDDSPAQKIANELGVVVWAADDEVIPYIVEYETLWGAVYRREYRVEVKGGGCFRPFYPKALNISNPRR